MKKKTDSHRISQRQHVEQLLAQGKVKTELSNNVV